MQQAVSCSFDTNSSTDAMDTNSPRENDEDLGLPESLKKLLHLNEAEKQSSSLLAKEEEEEEKNNSESHSSLDETIRRDFLESVSAAVRNLEEAADEALSRHHPTEWNEVQSSFSSPGKYGLREKLEYRIKLTEHKRDTSAQISTGQEEKQELPDKYTPAGLAITDKYSLSAKTGHISKPAQQQPTEELSSVLKKYQHPRKPRNFALNNSLSKEAEEAQAAKKQAQTAANVFMRLTRQVRYGRRSDLTRIGQSGVNKIKLHIYDLIPAETVMQLPWGCYFPIGRCFDVVNNSLHSMGTGAYHVGVEINGIEYSYGACEIADQTGVFSCSPQRSPGYQYRSTIDFGERALLKKAWVSVSAKSSSEGMTSGSSTPAYREIERGVDGREVMKQMATEYMGIDYDLLRKNCVTFAHDACIRLGVKEEEIPTWFRNLCESGALTQDVALQTVEPIQNIFSTCEDYGDFEESNIEDGFEVITTTGNKGAEDLVKVINAFESSTKYQCNNYIPDEVRKTLSWTY